MLVTPLLLICNINIFITNKQKIVKNSLIIGLLILVSNAIFAQSAFDKYDGQEDVISVIVNKKMFQMMGNAKVDANDKETQQYITLIKKLDNLKVLTTTSSKITADMKITTDLYWKVAGLTELKRSSNKGEKLRIWYKSGVMEGRFTEILMFDDGSGNKNETILMSLTGDFNLNEVSILMNKMKIPGVDNLKNATTSM